ncbi:MAG: hypothetical protein WAJ88_05075 [Pseudolabrys sp.]
MFELKAADARYPTVEFVLGAIARWIKKRRSLHGVRDELRQCSQDEAMNIARDLGVPLGDLRGLAAKAPDAANDVSKMLYALSVDESTLAKGDPATMRDLQRTCMLCVRKGRCRHEFASFTAARNFHEFCPNAYTLDALLRQKEQQRQH